MKKKPVKYPRGLSDSKLKLRRTVLSALVHKIHEADSEQQAIRDKTRAAEAEYRQCKDYTNGLIREGGMLMELVNQKRRDLALLEAQIAEAHARHELMEIWRVTQHAIGADDKSFFANLKRTVENTMNPQCVLMSQETLDALVSGLKLSPPFTICSVPIEINNAIKKHSAITLTRTPQRT